MFKTKCVLKKVKMDLKKSIPGPNMDVTFLRLYAYMQPQHQLHDPAAALGCFLFYEWMLGGAMMSVLLVRTSPHPTPHTHTSRCGKSLHNRRAKSENPPPPPSTYPTHPSACTRLLSSSNHTCSPIRETSFSQSAKGLADARRPPFLFSLSLLHAPFFPPKRVA